MKIWAVLFSFLFLCRPLHADDELQYNEPQYNEIETKVDEHAIPSLVNMSALPSSLVAGCVNVITGDFCESGLEDTVSGPEPYQLGHTYTSSGFDTGTLGDGWNFFHYNRLEVFQHPRVVYIHRKANGCGPIAILLPYQETCSSEDEIAYDDNESDESVSEQDLFFLSTEDISMSDTFSDTDFAEEADSDVYKKKLPQLEFFSSEEFLPEIYTSGPFMTKGDDQTSRSTIVGKKPPRTKIPLFVSIFDPSGGRLIFKTMYDEEHPSRSMRHFKLVSEHSGYTNVIDGHISGQTNLKNITLTWDKHDNCFTATLGDGTKRIYEAQKNPDHSSKKYRNYRLHKEIKPSGNIIVYDYSAWENKITAVRTYNKDLSHKLNKIKFERKGDNVYSKGSDMSVNCSIVKPKQKKYLYHGELRPFLASYPVKTTYPTLRVTTSDGLEHVYYFKRITSKGMDSAYSVSGIKRAGFGYIRYTYCKKSPRHKRRVIRKEHEDGSYIEVKYYRPADNEVGSRTVEPSRKKAKFIRNRVRMLMAPVGPKGEKHITHRFFYYKGKNGAGHTKVYDAHNNITRYYWNKDRRLSCIKKHDAKEHLLMKERYIWGENKTKDEGRLLGRILYDEEKSPKLARLFKYDDCGNIITDTLYGRFSENSGSLRIEHGFPHHESCDKISTTYTYSDDGYNLKTSECDPKGNYTYYKYKKGTNLLEAKFLCDKEQIKKREFFAYDNSAILIEHIVDDGTEEMKDNLKNAKIRRITKIMPRKERPYFGQAERIEEYAYDFTTHCEVLLCKTEHTFSKRGYIVKKKVYDQNNDYVTFEYDHDSIGRVVYTKNPEGDEEFFSYDLQGRLIKKKRSNISCKYVYDKAGRLVAEIEKQKDLVLSTKYAYDLLGRKIIMKDPQGNKTTYVYDALDRVVNVRYPPTYDHKGKPTISKRTYSYERLGTKVTITDPNNHETVTTYNALGEVTSIHFPDLTKRYCFYDERGNLTKEIAPNEAITYNYYDVFNRLKVSRILKDDELLSRKEVRYNTFYPIKEIGPTGETVTYAYDFAGRKISETQSGRKGEQRLKTFSYDAKGCLEKARIFINSESYLGKAYSYNKLDQVITERLYDTKKTHSYKYYSYDIEGNCTSVTQNIDGQEAIQKTSYYPHGKIRRITDAMGNKTHIFYDYFYKNDHGKRVICKKTVDPRGVVTKEIYDARHNLSEEIRLDSFGHLLSKKKLFYDASNNLVRVHETVIANNQELKMIELKTIITKMSYGPMNRLESITQAYKTPEQKTTRYTYNHHGQKNADIFSDGTLLHYTYDAKGRVSRYYSSDKTIDYSYTYDASDHLLKAKNNLTKTHTRRWYNDFGEVYQEYLETGIKIRYSYDGASRLKELSLPDSSKVAYSYTPVYLGAIERKDASSNTLYTHKILERDLSGYIKRVELAFGNDTCAFSRDKLGRCTKIDHSAFSQTTGGFDPAGNLLQLTTRDPQGKYERSFSYDYLSQLTNENGLSEHSYSYDSLYNRLSHNDASYEVNSLHSVLTDSKHTYTYDSRGNRTAMKGSDTVTYKYDALDRLIEVQKEDKRFEYRYDACNRRIEKKVISQDEVHSTQYLYALENEIGAMQNNTIVELRVLGEGLGAEIGAAVAHELYGKTYVPIHDRQGNVSVLFDQDGNLAETYRYDAFGNETVYSNVPTRNPWRFSSKRVDEETGFVYFGRRYYDPSLGKWLTQDPLGLKAGPNLYAYVLNNPMIKLDQFGLIEEQTETNTRSFTEKVSDVIVEVATKVRDLACKIGEEIVHNLPHVGKLNNKVEDTLRSWRGAQPKQRHDSGLYKAADGTPTSKGCVAVVYANGLFCNDKDSKKNAQFLREKFNGAHPDMYVAYSRSDGICMDFFRSLLNVLGVSTSNIQAIANGLEPIIQNCKNMGENFYILGLVHSNGGRTLHLAESMLGNENAQLIVPKTFGSSFLYRDRGQNYTGGSDFVPLLADPFGFVTSVVKGFFGESNLTFTGHPFKLPFYNHRLRSSEYSDAINHIVSKHV